MDGDIVSIAKAEEIMYLEFYFITITLFQNKRCRCRRKENLLLGFG